MFKLDFFKGKKILVTGHTGFKGSWLSYILVNVGAEVTGISLEPQSSPNLYEMLELESRMKSYIKDITDLDFLIKIFQREEPEIVLHLAAQPLVRESYQNPVRTYSTNVMGTVNILECIRLSNSVKSFLNVTTDKVYRNKEWEWGYRENEELCGYDPYSNSKSCSELVTYSYLNSFFKDKDIAISTARAGNVIGGGDFAVDRIIPDCVRACAKNENIIVRNPNSIRPYQHVLEPLMAYLVIVEKQYQDKMYAGNYNVGPDEIDCISTGKLVSLFCNSWKKHSGEKVNWVNKSDRGPHEASFLKLDCTKFKTIFKWSPTWHIEKSIEKAVEWYQAYTVGEDVKEIMYRQLMEYIQDGENRK